MDINEIWEKFGYLTNSNKDEFIKLNKKIDKAISEMTTEQKEYLRKTTLEFINTLNEKHTLEQRLEKQHALLKLTNQTDRTLQQFIKENKEKLNEMSRM